MVKQVEGGKSSRRDFLKLASVTAPVAIAGVALSGTKAEAAQVEQTASGVRDTPHTKAYFESTRF